MNSTLAVDRNDTPIDLSVDSHFYSYNKSFTINLGLDQPVHIRIVNEIFPVPDQQLLISIPNSKNTDQVVHLQRLIILVLFSHGAAQLNIDGDTKESPVYPLYSRTVKHIFLYLQNISL